MSGYENGKFRNVGVRQVMNSLLQIGHRTHTMLVYPNIKTIREVYTKYFQSASQKGTEMIAILPYYETIESVKNNLMEDTESIQNYNTMTEDGTLIIRDSNTLFDRDIKSDSFSGSDHRTNPQIVDFLNGLLSDAKKKNRVEVSVWIDTGAFHNYRGGTELLLEFEKMIPTFYESTPLKQFCLYHQKDFEMRLDEHQETATLDYHQKRLLLLGE